MTIINVICPGIGKVGRMNKYMDLLDRKKAIIFFKIKDLVCFINQAFEESRGITGFLEEILVGLFLLRWFKDGRRGDSNFLMGFKYKESREKEIIDLLSRDALSLEIFNKKYSNQSTLSDIIIKSFYSGEVDPGLYIHFQIKAFPRENNPATITEDLIAFLERKKRVALDNEILLIYSHYTIGLDAAKLLTYLETYPYDSIIHVFWTNKKTLNFLKLKPQTNQNMSLHYSLNYTDLFES